MSEVENDSKEAENELPASTAEDRLILMEYIKEAQQRFATKEEIRTANLNATRPPDTYFSKLDSSLKKNTTFVKKLKNFCSAQLDTVLKDMANLNLTKYISEVATALVEAKLKMTDVGPAVKVCSCLHQNYTEFGAHFFENWQRILSFKVGDKITNPSKLRVDLRFYAELVNAGIFTHKQGLPLLGSVLTVLINMDKEDHNNVTIILSFCRHCGEDYAGLIPKRVRELSALWPDEILPKSKLLSADKQQNVRTLLRDYYNSLCKHLLKEHKELQAFEKQNRKILQTRGELSSERREKLEALQVSYDRLLNGVQSFAETLDESMPELPVDAEFKTEAEESIKMTNEGEENGTTAEDMWGDEETKRFYEVFPDLTVFLPGSYSKETPALKPDESQLTEEALDEELTLEELEDADKVPDEPEAEAEVEETHVSNISNKILLDAFLTHLPNCVNREMIDNAAVDFLMNLNTKHNRKKLIKALFGVSRIRLDLLPFYSRLAGILYPVMPDVANDLCLMLKQDFKYHVRKKDQINIESKIKVVRYIGELVKFKLYSKIEALYCLKVLLHDFTHHHVEMACNLLETCGRFLFCSPDSHQRTKVYLEQMMRKKAVTALDSRYVTIIENAYYFVNPPESTGGIAKKERPPMHEFIRKLLYQDLSKANTDKVLRLMRKLDWEDDGVSTYAVKCLVAAHNVKYLNIRCVGSLLAGLVAHYEAVGPHVVDGVLEDIRLCMEVNLPKYNQRRIAMVKYLGELYNYRLVESGDIFRTLYLLITFGVATDHAAPPTVLDPPEHLFRIRLVCTLLETCGQYFSGGSSKKKLDYFLIFFQHYYWFKRSDPVWTTPDNPFPVGIDYMYRDTLSMLRSKMQLFQSFKEARCAVDELRNTLYPSLAGNTTKEEYAGEQLGTADNNNDVGEAMGAILEVDEETAIGTGNGSGDAKAMGELHFEESEEYSEAQSEDDWAAEGYRGEGALGTQENTQGELSLSAGVGEGVVMDPSELDAALPIAPRRVGCPEDDDFLSALDKMVSDNIQDRMRDSVKPQQVDISVPLHVKSTKKTYEQLREVPSDSTTVDFVLMLRKGNKQQYKNLAVPVSSELAMNLRNRELEQKEEKERVKRLTLNITERQEEEDYQETINQGTRPVTVNLNRERRQKYNHPKGAPDADLIFGPKKIR